MKTSRLLILLTSFFITGLSGSSDTFKNSTEAIKQLNIDAQEVFTNLPNFELNKSKDFKKWTMTVDQVSRYVKEMANGDKDLLTPLSITNDAQNELINALKIAYRSFKSYKGARAIFKNLATTKQKLIKSDKSLQSTTFIKPSKRDARTALRKLNEILLQQINKIEAITTIPLVKQNYASEVYKALGITKESNVYAALGLKSDASDEDVRSTYRKLSAKWHPDKNTAPQAAEVTKLINASKACILDAPEYNSSACR